MCIFLVEYVNWLWTVHGTSSVNIFMFSSSVRAEHTICFLRAVRLQVTSGIKFWIYDVSSFILLRLSLLFLIHNVPSCIFQRLKRFSMRQHSVNIVQGNNSFLLRIGRNTAQTLQVKWESFSVKTVGAYYVHLGFEVLDGESFYIIIQTNME